MTYFIDFEAACYSEEIISVGCIAEDGTTFYSLVAPKEGKITPHITALTKIEKEMLDDAASADAVFSAFYDWVFCNEEAPTFYCWGDGDVRFVINTAKRTTTLKAKMALGYLAANMIDYGNALKKYLSFKHPMGLLKTANKFDDSLEQTHNALDDAILLKYIFDKTHECGRQELLNKFIDWVEEKTIKTELFVAGAICATWKDQNYYFDNINKAVEWLETTFKINHTNNYNITTYIRHINRAIRSGKKYMSIRWKEV